MNTSTILVLILVLIFSPSYTANSESRDVGELPFCSDLNIELKRLVFVSTLDGKVSALRIDDGGSVKWTISTGPGPMLSSSIHNLELTNNGQWVRMIPSLSGGLYKMNGKRVEAVPITADNLLKSSFKYSDDIVISGGIESRTYAVEANSGNILYECTMMRCDNNNNYNNGIKRGDIVLIRRQTQTVRAIEPRSGVERWNFSVGQHDVKLAPDPTTYCSSSQFSTDMFFKVIVPEGLICAMSKSKPGVVLWKHKFEFPVVSAWQIERGDLKWVDLFEGARNQDEKVFIPESPLLYIGMHNKQLYIQESVRLQKKILESSSKLQHHMITDESLPSIPWKPIPAGIEGPTEPLQITDETSQASATAMSVLYGSEYVNGKGFFLYGSLDNDKNSNIICSNEDDKVNITLEEEKDSDVTFLSDDEEFSDDETPVQIIIVSFWYWWKEVMMMSLFMAVVVNIIIQRRLITFFFWVKHNQQIENSASARDSAISSVIENKIEFKSRYLADFEPVHCLGKGGFGIVFEAKNKIDDCHYAIKRIPLSNKEESSDRMKREVKALAKLDHQNIVRYFNSWVEEPPENWQEAQDKQWALSHNDILSSDVALDLSSQLNSANENQVVRKRNTILNSFWNQATNYYKNSLSIEKTRNKNWTNDSSDSFIVFENSKNSKLEESGSIVSEEEVSVANRYDKSKEPSKRLTSLFTKSTRNSPNLSFQKKYLYIQMQLCRRDSLKDWLSANQERSSSEVIRIFNQIVHAVEYVHFQGLIHRDLKPSNIFFSLDGQIKVGDFGLVTAMADEEIMDTSCSLLTRKALGKHTARVGTQLYMSPEQVSGQQYDYKVDIYSLGVILFELLINFKTEMERYKTLEGVRMLKFPKTFDVNHPSEYELLKLMLSENPKMRPTTIGIRSREPLKKFQTEGTVHEDWHFQLPHRQREPSISRSSNDS